MKIKLTDKDREIVLKVDSIEKLIDILDKGGCPSDAGLSDSEGECLDCVECWRSALKEGEVKKYE